MPTNSIPPHQTSPPQYEAASEGERLAQDLYGSRERAERFYRDQMLDVLTATMITFVERQTQMFIGSVDVDGRPDLSVRFGEEGFVHVIDEHTLCWPELRGNGVMTTLGNLVKNPAAHLMFLDGHERIGLHLRGDVELVEVEHMLDRYPRVASHAFAGRGAERWAVFTLERSYIHCRKHFPLDGGTVDWGTDDPRAKGGDYFGAKAVATPWSNAPSDEL